MSRSSESIKELREICQESRYAAEGGMPWFERYFYRSVSIHFTKIFLKIGISANQATLLSLIFGLFGGFFLIFTNLGFWALAIGALFLVLCLIFDRVDGEIARYKKSCSKVGAHFDLMVGSTLHPYLLFCMTFGAFNVLQDTTVFIFGFLAVILNLLYEIHLISYEEKWGGKFENKREATKDKKGERQGRIIEKYAYRPVRRVSSFLGPGAIIYAILIVVALDLCFTPFRLENVPIFFVINARYAFLIIYSVGKIGSFVVKAEKLIQQT